MHEVLVNHLGDLSLPGKRVVRLTDRLDMAIAVYCGSKQKQLQNELGQNFQKTFCPRSVTLRIQRIKG